MLYKNMKVKVCSPNWDSDFFDIVVGVLQGVILAPYLFVICLDYILWMSIDLMKENCLTLEKARSRRYPAQNTTDADYIALLANTPTQAEFLLHNLDWAVGGIGLHGNTDKTEYMCFNQSDNISTLNGGSLNLVDKFTNLRHSISSIENDITMQVVKAQTAIDRLLVIRKSDLTYKIKCIFLLHYGCTT